MQNNFLNSIRSMKLIDGCKGTQVHAMNTSSTVAVAAEKLASLRPTFSLRSKSLSQHHNHQHPAKSQNQPHHCRSPSIDAFLSSIGLPCIDLIEPSIDPFLRPIELIDALASSFRSMSSSSSPSDLFDIYLEQCSLYRGIDDPKLLRRALRFARIKSPDVHHRIVLSAWLRFDRREDELEPFASPLFCSPTTPTLECPRAALYSSKVASDSCPCRSTLDKSASSLVPDNPPDLNEDDMDLWFCIGNEEIPCVRSSIAALSRPLSTLLYGSFAEARRDRINS